MHFSINYKTFYFVSYKAMHAFIFDHEGWDVCSWVKLSNYIAIAMHVCAVVARGCKRLLSFF